MPRVAWAPPPPRQGGADNSTKLHEIRDFTGGLNVTASPFQLAENESPDMMNLIFEERGSVKPRPGSRMIYRQTDERWKAHQLAAVAEHGNPDVLVAMAYYDLDNATNGQVTFRSLDFPSDAFDTTGIVGSGTTYSHALTHGPPALVPVGGDNREMLVLKANAATYRYSDNAGRNGNLGTTFSTDPDVVDPDMTPANCRDGVFHAERLWVAVGDKVYFSVPGRLNFLSTSWIMPANPQGQSEPIMALCTFRDHVVVFGRRHMWAIYGYDESTFSVSYIGPVGTFHSGTRLATRFGVVFWNEDEGVYLYDGTAVAYVFEPLRQLLEGDDIDRARQTEVRFGVVDDLICVSVPQSFSGPSFQIDGLVYALDVREENRSWTRWAWEVGGFAEATDAGNDVTEHLFMGQVRGRVSSDQVASDPADGIYLWRKLHGLPDPGELITDFVAGDFGTTWTVPDPTGGIPVEAWFATSWVDLGEPDLVKRWTGLGAVVELDRETPTAMKAIPFLNYRYPQDPGVAVISIETDAVTGGEDVLTWGVDPWGFAWGPIGGGAGRTYVALLRFGSVGRRSRSMLIRFSPATQGGYFGLMQVSLKYKGTKVAR